MKTDKNLSENAMVEALLSTGVFFLGGSRRMAEKYPEQVSVGVLTDWDIYGAYTCTCVAHLERLGFDFTPTPDYHDDLLDAIFKHPKHNIQVLLRSDVETYRLAFEAVPVNVFVNHLWKSSPKRPKGVTDKVMFERNLTYFNRLFKALKDMDYFEGLDEITF
jgi:hypothetical protein